MIKWRKPYTLIIPMYKKPSDRLVVSSLIKSLKHKSRDRIVIVTISFTVSIFVLYGLISGRFHCTTNKAA